MTVLLLPGETVPVAAMMIFILITLVIAAGLLIDMDRREERAFRKTMKRFEKDDHA